jgi:hypothetical protein
MIQTLEGKALGPNGFTIDFFLFCRNFIKEDVWKIVEESHKTLGVLPAFSATFIILIPKEECSLTQKSFLPIALCNVIFKSITKVLTNRLKIILPLVIPKEQTGYVEG